MIIEITAEEFGRRLRDIFNNQGWTPEERWLELSNLFYQVRIGEDKSSNGC